MSTTIDNNRVRIDIMQYKYNLILMPFEEGLLGLSKQEQGLYETFK